MAHSEDYFVGEDSDALFVVIDEDFLQSDLDFISEVDQVVHEVNNDQIVSFTCEECGKVCKTKRGMCRHKNIKHACEDTVSNRKEERSAESLCHPLYFKKFVEQCLHKLSLDECYPTEMLNEFKSLSVTLADTNYAYQLVKYCFENFDGNGEKFYAKFYNSITKQHTFKNLSYNSSNLLGCEVTNYVLAHIYGKSGEESVTISTFTMPDFSQKERSIIHYLGGYVFSKLHKNVYSLSNSSSFTQQSLLLLRAGKYNNESQDLNHKDYELINVRNRGGLWKITSNVFNIFCVTENCFRQNTKTTVKKLTQMISLQQS